MFLTLEDPRAKIQGSRDPLGVQPIWSRFGRELVTNLTTVSRSVRGFGVLLLARYYAERLIREGRATEEDAVPIFLRFEQIAAYARRLRSSEGEQDIVLGVTRVNRFLDEYGGKVPIRNDATGLILSDQKTYGLWGLYSVSARVSGLLAEGTVGLTDWAREIVEAEYVHRLRPVEGKLIKLLLDGGTLDTKKGRQPFECVATLFSGQFSSEELSFYRDALRDATKVDRPHEATRQRQLASLISKYVDRNSGIGRAAVVQLALAAQDAGDAGLAEKLQRILRVEAVLAPAEAVFEHLQSRNGQTPQAVADALKDHWGNSVPNLSSPLEPLMSEIRLAVGDATAEQIHRCDHALSAGDYTEAAVTILDWNREVMAGRGSAPWVKLTQEKLDVRYRSTDKRLPTKEALPELWANSYFIDALRDVVFQLEDESDGE